MDLEKLRKLTGILCLAFGIYCIIAAVLVIAFEAVAFFIIFALIFLAFGIFYIVVGISLLGKGKYGTATFIGVFIAVYWWGPGLPWYYWPMIIMPILITLMYIVMFFNSNLASGE